MVDAVNQYFDWDLWEKRVQYEVDGALPKAEMDVQMLESLYELNMKFGYKNDKVTDADIVKIRQQAFDRRQKLGRRVTAIRGRFYNRPELDYLKEAYDWLARQEAKGRKIGEEDFILEEE